MPVLRRFTPHVEPLADYPGFYWLDASGLQPLFASVDAWANELIAALVSSVCRAAIVVGFNRFATFALVHSVSPSVISSLPSMGTSVLIMKSAAEEYARIATLTLAQIFAESSLQKPVRRSLPWISVDRRNALAKLGIETIAELRALPAQGLLERYGADIYRLHRLVSQSIWDPFIPEEEVSPLVAAFDLDDDEEDSTRLFFLLKRTLDPLLRKLGERHEALTRLTFALTLDNTSKTELKASFSTAMPTRDSTQIYELLRLRLEALTRSIAMAGCGVISGIVRIESAQVDQEQGLLFSKQILGLAPRRDRRAALRALARLRAEFGEGVVVRARLRPRHLPEARFEWESLTTIVQPQVALRPSYQLVRRLLVKAKELSQVPPLKDGPYFISGGWWQRLVHREYYFARGKDDEIHWVYFDQRRARWLLHAVLD